MRALRLLLPLLLIGLCLWAAGPQKIAARLGSLSPGWMAAAVLLLVLVTLLSALRWRIAAGALGLPLSAGGACREYFMAQFVNQTLPGGVLGDAARAQRSRQGGALLPAAQAVVLERAAGQAGMAAVFGLGLMFAPHPLPPAIAAAAAVFALLLALAGLALFARRRGAWSLAARAALVAHLPAQAALSLAIAGLTVAGFAAAARATGTALPPAMAALIVPAILTAMLLPASVAGWGWREGAAAALFPLAGAEPAAGIAAGIAFGLAALAAAFPGAFFVLRPREAGKSGCPVASPAKPPRLRKNRGSSA
ncbi:lysylphosphatidylglycerol synthase transmembrane domain-containing protein [Poseidonocella sp. HB161398]|uniref:lysylphosphatidylglycerol synthase transmembrane domain-containing protein n=1 Tax=Poseidonocella sp. HB161398 TaxID=2320855 RepID=UPI00110863DF|nr:lysylphosphatidylglycerol synthase transmembrane domain-containing protein [Poseidonocella sp. HB161398]